MGHVLVFILGTVASWVLLLIVLPIAQRFAEFELPPLVGMLWKLAVVAAAVNGASVLLGFLGGWASWIGSMVVFWTLMVKWFDVDLFGAMVIVLVSWILRAVALAGLLALLAGLRG
ncbi:MAG: hypothetical protein V2A58_06100 [Planctomycetota bacterium]